MSDTIVGRLCILLALVLVPVRMSPAQDAAAEGDKLDKLEYIAQSPRGTVVIAGTADPFVAATSYCCGLGARRTKYSRLFRTNEDDLTMFAGLDYGLFTGFRSNTALRDIMKERPQALLGLAEFDKAARSSTVLTNIGVGFLAVSALAIVSVFVLPKNQENDYLEAKVAIFTAAGALAVALGFGAAGEYQNASAFRKLVLAVDAYGR